MAIRHYNGEIGVFDYDDNDFVIESFYNEDILRYCGSERDGSKIVIPDGIIKCDYMFCASDFGSGLFVYLDEKQLLTPPNIPNGVLSCQGMFDQCEALQEPPLIPDSVIDCYSMFSGCKSMKYAPDIPDSVTVCSGMFSGCSFTEPPLIPKSAKQCDYMFSGCSKLKRMPDIPDKVINCESMFDGCHNLTEILSIPENVLYCDCMFEWCDKLVETPLLSFGIKDCRNMFGYCKSLIRVNNIPDSIVNCDEMFQECENLTEVPALSKGIRSCNKMFENCKSLCIAPEIPSNVISCNRMFYGCKSLSKAPVIPVSVKSSNISMFEGCKNTVKKAGEWNIRNKGLDYYIVVGIDESEDDISDDDNSSDVYVGSKMSDKKQMSWAEPLLSEDDDDSFSLNKLFQDENDDFDYDEAFKNALSQLNILHEFSGILYFLAFHTVKQMVYRCLIALKSSGGTEIFKNYCEKTDDIDSSVTKTIYDLIYSSEEINITKDVMRCIFAARNELFKLENDEIVRFNGEQWTVMLQKQIESFLNKKGVQYDVEILSSIIVTNGGMIECNKEKEAKGMKYEKKIPDSFCGHHFTDDEKTALLDGFSMELTDCVSKSGKPFSCQVSYGKKENGYYGIIVDFEWVKTSK